MPLGQRLIAGHLCTREVPECAIAKWCMTPASQSSNARRGVFTFLNVLEPSSAFRQEVSNTIGVKD